MCAASKPKAPAPAVPLPEETVKPTMVDVAGNEDRQRRSGRSRLTVPVSPGYGMSGLNIPR